MWPYGGNLSAADLAEKFGWPSVVLSLLLLPFTTLYTWVLASPPCLSCLRRNKKVGLRYTYPSKYGSGFIRENFYEDTKNVTGAWSLVIKADPQGGLWYERYWGIVNVLKLEVVEENRHWRLSGGWFTWFAPSVDLYFDDDHADQYLDLGAQLQPFGLFTLAFALPAVGLFALYATKWLKPRDSKIAPMTDEGGPRDTSTYDALLQTDTESDAPQGASKSGRRQAEDTSQWNACSSCCVCAFWMFVIIYIVLLRGVHLRGDWPTDVVSVTQVYQASPREVFEYFSDYPTFFNLGDASATIGEPGALFNGKPVGEHAIRRVAAANGAFVLNERIYDFDPPRSFRYYPQWLSGPAGALAIHILEIHEGLYVFEKHGRHTKVTWNTTNIMPYQWQLNLLHGFLSKFFLGFMEHAHEALDKNK